MKQDISITYNWKTKPGFFIPYKKATKINDFSQTRFEEALKLNVFSQTRFEELRMWEPVTTGVESGSVFEEARFLKVLTLIENPLFLQTPKIKLRVAQQPASSQ